MSRLWLRRVVATFSGSGGTLEVEDLKIDFSVKRTIGANQNPGTITVTNLKKDNRDRLGKEYDRVRLDVGYRGGPFGTIFDGHIRKVEHKPSGQGADIESTVTLGDGDRGVNRGVVSRTWPPGTRPAQIVRDLVQTMPDVTMGPMVGIDDLPPYRRPVSMFGFSSRELDQLGREHQFYWSIQSGRFQALGNDRVLPGSKIVIAPDTGMIGVPTKTDRGVSVTALINPELTPGREIEVRSDFLDENAAAVDNGGSGGRQSRGGGRGASQPMGSGTYRIASLTFSGSNRDTQFQAAIEAHRTQGGRVTSE